MKLTDKLISVYLKRVLLPKLEDYSNPGYVLTRSNDDPERAVLRDIFIPEKLVASIESKTISAKGEDGRRLLYSIGKNCGYTYSRQEGISTIKSIKNKKDFDQSFRFLLLFIGGTYGGDVEYEFDVEKKTVDVSFSTYVVCELNGVGEIFTSGSAAGMWAWMTCDKNIEGVQVECIGRRDQKCRLLLGPPELLRDANPKPLICSDLLEVDRTEIYFELNKVRKTENSMASLDNLIENKIINFKNSRMEFRGDKYFECDVHYIYILEHLYKDDDALFNITKSYYQSVGDSMKQNLGTPFISDFLGALGWGDIQIYNNRKVYIKHYPYTSLYQKTSYPIIRGMLSGLLTSLYGDETRFSIAKPILETDEFSLILE